MTALVETAGRSGMKGSARVPILAYHWLVPTHGDVAHRFEISTVALAAQLRRLLRLGYHAVSVDRLSAALTAGASLPERPFCVTFDDGTEDLFELGLPVLCEFNVPAAVFVVASRVGQTYDWDKNRGVRPRPMLGWTRLREMAELGFTIGSHSLTHPDLTAVSPEAAGREIVESRKLVEDKIGRAVSFFAYPYGRCHGGLKRVVCQAGYQAAFGIQASLRGFFGSDILDLKRALVKGTEGAWAFRVRFLCASLRHRGIARLD